MPSHADEYSCRPEASISKFRGVSHGVVVSALRCGWENLSSSPPGEFELDDNCQIIITQPFPEVP